MASVTFSVLEYLSGPDLLALLRRRAKVATKTDPLGNILSWHQDKIAVSLGFKNWSLLRKHLAPIEWAARDHVLGLILKKPDLGKFVVDRAVKTIDEDEGTETMTAWVRGKFTPLIDFAYYDNEAENGFSWPDVDVAQELQDEFAGQYPDDLIESVASLLEEAGPWGLDDRNGHDDDIDEAPTVNG